MRKVLIMLGATAIAAPLAFAAPAAAATIAPAAPAAAYSAPAFASAFDVTAANYDEQRNRRYREWRGRDGRTYCRRNDGTTGLVVGGVAGALAGRAIDTRGDRTVGTLLGAAAGAVAGREIERGGSRRCR